MSIPGASLQFTSWITWSMKLICRGLWSDGNVINVKTNTNLALQNLFQWFTKILKGPCNLVTSDRRGQPFSFLFNAPGFLCQGLWMMMRQGFNCKLLSPQILAWLMSIHRESRGWRASVLSCSNIALSAPRAKLKGSLKHRRFKTKYEVPTRWSKAWFNDLKWKLHLALL